MANTKPTVFIGSSHESSDVVDAIASALRADAQVRPWTDTDLFPAGEFILNSLLRQAQRFDFAIMVFGPDDVVLQGSHRVSVPRDNVVFELGLFMSQLERERTLLLVPVARHGRIKILSDLGGLKAIEYTYPDERDHGGLNRALRDAIKQIRKRIKERGARVSRPAIVYQGPTDVFDIGSAVTELAEQAWGLGKLATVRNIALDMGSTWDIIHGRVLAKTNVTYFDWKSVMIDPTSRAIKDVEGRTVSTRLAGARIKQIQSTCASLDKELAARRVGFGCRGYGSVPVLHGFLINASVLFLTMTRMENGELIGAPNAYLKFEASAGQEPTEHAFKVFSDWFEHLWANGSAIWPMKPTA